MLEFKGKKARVTVDLSLALSSSCYAYRRQGMGLTGRPESDRVVRN